MCTPTAVLQAPSRASPPLLQNFTPVAALHLTYFTPISRTSMCCLWCSNLVKHASEISRMQSSSYRDLTLCVEAALTIMRLSCEHYFTLISVLAAYLLFRQQPPLWAKRIIWLNHRVSTMFKKVGCRCVLDAMQLLVARGLYTTLWVGFTKASSRCVGSKAAPGFLWVVYHPDWCADDGMLVGEAGPSPHTGKLPPSESAPCSTWSAATAWGLQWGWFGACGLYITLLNVVVMACLLIGQHLPFRARGISWLKHRLSITCSKV